jgi:hypothetical protein
MKNNIFILAAILALLATACKKENPQNDLAVTPITISASYGVNDGAKVNYTESGNDITATWEAGDQLYVVYNNHVNTLTLSAGAGTASATFTGSIVGTPTATSPLFCYVRDANNPSAVTVSPTGEYTYASGTFLAQDGTLASAAKCNLFYGATTYGNGTNISCTFSPNTSMMKLTVSAPAGVLPGATATLTYKSATTDLAKATFTVGANGWNTLYLTVPAGEYTGTQAFVYQSGETNETRTLSDTQACFAAGQTYRKGVYFGISIPDGAINGMFTINARGDKVYFSKGNLQYKDGTGWRFAEHQYDCVGAWNTSDWVDLIGWGTWGEGKNPLNTSTNNADYLWSTDFSGTLTNANSTGWRTMTYDEWNYLLNSRQTGNSVNGTNHARFTKATINTDGTSKCGLIIFPDNYSGGTPDGVTWGSINASVSGWGTSCTTAGWRTMEEAGCVFLPTSGERVNGTTIQNVSTLGLYWYSTSYDSNYAWYLVFLNSAVNPDKYHKWRGCSVRLVCPVN